MIQCGTAIPVVAAKVAVRIDRGYHNSPRVVDDPHQTGSDGEFRVGLAEPPRAWVTLTFTKDEFATLETHLQGEPAGEVDLCMSRTATEPTGSGDTLPSP